MIKRTLAALLFVSLPAAAQVHTYSFTAEIGSMFEHDSQSGRNTNMLESSLPGSLFRIGDFVHGAFSYDATALVSPHDTNGSSDGYLVFGNAIRSFSFTVTSTSYQYKAAFGQGSNLLLSDDSTNPLGWDTFSPNSWAAFDSTMFRSADINLFDRTGTAVNGYALPDALSLDSFHYSNLHFAWLRRGDGDQFHFNGPLRSMSPVTPVPELSSFVMLLAGLCAVSLWVRRQQRLLIRPSSSYRLL